MRDCVNEQARSEQLRPHGLRKIEHSHLIFSGYYDLKISFQPDKTLLFLRKETALENCID